MFSSQLIRHIRNNFDDDYEDPNYYFFITCNHENNNINYLNLASKWYLSRCYQMEKPVSWPRFISSLENTMIGEAKSLRDTILHSVL